MTTTLTPTADTPPRAYLSSRTTPGGTLVYTVICRSVPAMADTEHRATAVAVAEQVCGANFWTWDGDRGEFLPPADGPAVPHPHKLPAPRT